MTAVTWTSYGSSDWLPLNSWAFPNVPHRKQEHAEKWGYEKGGTGWYEQEDKVLIPEAQQCKLPESLHDVTYYGRDALRALMQKAFSREGA